jgi:hypothetical protein
MIREIDGMTIFNKTFLFTSTETFTIALASATLSRSSVSYIIETPNSSFWDFIILCP